MPRIHGRPPRRWSKRCSGPSTASSPKSDGFCAEIRPPLVVGRFFPIFLPARLVFGRRERPRPPPAGRRVDSGRTSERDSPPKLLLLRASRGGFHQPPLADVGNLLLHL